jgi:hypothetical protein
MGQGRPLLDRLTSDYIREHLGYRFLVTRDGAEALTVECAIRGGDLPAGRPYLNPLQLGPPSLARAAGLGVRPPGVDQDTVHLAPGRLQVATPRRLGGARVLFCSRR